MMCMHARMCPLLRHDYMIEWSHSHLLCGMNMACCEQRFHAFHPQDVQSFLHRRCAAVLDTLLLVPALASMTHSEWRTFECRVADHQLAQHPLNLRCKAAS